jgi:hypothetical protein
MNFKIYQQKDNPANGCNIPYYFVIKEPEKNGSIIRSPYWNNSIINGFSGHCDLLLEINK